jgi:uncharacterized protein YdaU (DUF1376 family)
VSQFPAMPFWFDAYYGDTDHLTYEEHGIYLKVLRLLWHAPHQRIPNDRMWIERRFGAYTDKAMCLIQEFCECDGNFFSQKRVTREFTYLKAQSLKQSARAKSRWSKVNGECRGNAPTPTPTKKEKEREESSEKASQPVNEEPRARLFREGKDIMRLLGVKPDRAGAMIGKWLQSTPDCDGVLAALTYAYQNNVMDPISYVTKLLNTGGSSNGKAQLPAGDRARLIAAEIRKRELAESAGRQVGDG